MAQFEATNDVLTPLAILTANGALLAFLIGLYTLVGRERKSPYLINSVFFVFLVSVFSAVFGVLSALVSDLRSHLLDGATALLLFAFLLTCWRVYKLYVRFAYFVDRVSLKDLGLWRWMKNLRRKIKTETPYELKTDSIDAGLFDEILNILAEFSSKSCRCRERPHLGKNSLTLALEHQGQATDVLVRLAAAFLEKGNLVQYLTASRHPIEFVGHLVGHLKDKFNLEESSLREFAQRVVVVDAFTPHFGFTDSIHRVKTEEIEGMGISCLRSSASYAGMHTAASRAFNLVKSRAESDVRKPALVIYEDTRALADLESPEQYRIFIRHVLPSERMWDGMFTVFTEVAPPEDDWKMLSGYSSVNLDMRPDGDSGKADQDTQEQ